MEITLSQMRAFCAAVEAGSLSGAARRLEVSRSAVSRQVAALEEALGARLLHRTTRSLHPTDAGEGFYGRASRALEEAEAAEQAVRRAAHRPAGRLRLNGPVIAGELLVAVVGEYLGRYPEVEVDLTLEDAYVDLVSEGVDLAVRVGHPADSTLVSRTIAPVRQAVVGAPSYFEAHGRPRTPAELTAHQWVSYSLLASPHRFTFLRDGAQQTVQVSGRLSVNGGPALRRALLDGLGLSLIPAFYLAEELRSGALEEVLGDYTCKPSQLHAVYPHRRHLPQKVRLFLDLLLLKNRIEPW